MDEPMEIDLSPEEISAMNKARWASTARSYRYPRRDSVNRDPPDGSLGLAGLSRLTRGTVMDIDLSLDEVIERRAAQERLHQSIHPSRLGNIDIDIRPEHTSVQRGDSRCRHIQIFPLTPNTSKAAVREMLQSTIGPVQSVKILNDVAHVVFARMDGWKAVRRYNGKWLDGKSYP
ncbi:MAG: hypothetical protein TREMPRED_001688 [Tremellales sp. Tagirdzhanova-0007]|nr:MAG: hypothetical protein TREMPRED_001688 [Tremellales sp. Tagirdzhanova-0007]